MPPASARVVYRQLPTHSYTGWNNLGDVHSTLRELEFGRFKMAAFMYDQMFRDDRFFGTMRTRIDALESVPLDVNPADTRSLAVKLAEALGGDDDEPGQWDRQFPAPVIGELNRWGIGLNFGLAEIIWDTSDPKNWCPWLKPWHPQWVRWDWGTFSYKVMTADGEVELPRLDENPRGDGKWFIWCPFGYDQAWMKGLVRSAAVSVLERGLGRRDWGRYNEKAGLPLDKIMVPSDAKEEEKDAVFGSIAGRNGETAIMLEDPGEEAGRVNGKWDLELVEAKSQNWDTFQEHRHELNADIAIVVLGQNLTTEMGGSGASGSKAGGQVHEAVRRDKLRKDAGIAVAIRDQVLTWDAEFNFGDETLAPRPIYRVDPPEDKAANATALSTLATALATFKTAGAPVQVREILEDAEVPMMTPEEEAAAKAVAAEEAAAALEAQQSALGPPRGNPQGSPPSKGAPDPQDGGEKDVAEGTVKAGARRPFGDKGVAKRYTFAGLPIAIENPLGTLRTWTDADGKTGVTRMQFDYGFIDGHIGADGDEVDCYIGPDESAPDVHVVHQLAAPEFKRYDEDKTMLGFPSPDAAKAAYLAHRSDGDRAFGGMSTIPLPAFRAKLKRRTGTGKIRATSSATIEALSKLAGRAAGAMQLARKTASPKKLAYADALTKSAMRLGARALAVDLALVKHEVDQATDWKDLESRLLKAFKGMDPARFASAVQKTRIMANLSGQLSAVKQT